MEEKRRWGRPGPKFKTHGLQRGMSAEGDAPKPPVGPSGDCVRPMGSADIETWALASSIRWVSGGRPEGWLNFFQTRRIF